MGPAGRLLQLGLRRAAGLGARPEVAAAAAAAAPGELELERALRSRAKAVRERRLQRQMEPRGPPERSLSRQAMEQIRFLSREAPEEWPVGRLARGFQVPPDVVRRVLRSRFQPSAARAAKQDAKAAAQGEGGARTERGGREVFDAAGSLLYRVPEGAPPPPVPGGRAAPRSPGQGRAGRAGSGNGRGLGAGRGARLEGEWRAWAAASPPREGGDPGP